MKKYFVFILIGIMLMATVSCKKSAAPDFTAPDPVIETVQESKIEAPAPTSKPYSEYNQILKSAELISNHGMFVDSFYKNNLKELEDSSVIIVLATVKSKEQLEIPELKELGVTEETTLTTLEIEKVFKGSELLGDSSELKIEEICSIVEYDDGGKALATTGFYYPAKEYETYMFFLKELEGGVAQYTPTSRWYGKYPVTYKALKSKEENAMTCRTLELASDNLDSVAPGNIQALFKEVCNKYYSDSTVVSVLEVQEQQTDE